MVYTVRIMTLYTIFLIPAPLPSDRSMEFRH